VYTGIRGFSDNTAEEINMNNNNSLNLKRGSYGRIETTLSRNAKGEKIGITVFIPTVSYIANARVLNARQDGSVDVHWDSNYNTSGDFRSELMRFNPALALDTQDRDTRNETRIVNGLMPIN
jgi:hypothetical protein